MGEVAVISYYNGRIHLELLKTQWKPVRIVDVPDYIGNRHFQNTSKCKAVFVLKAYGEVEVKIHSILSSIIDKGAQIRGEGEVANLQQESNSYAAGRGSLNCLEESSGSWHFIVL